MKVSDFVERVSRLKYFNRWIIFFLDLFFFVCSTATVLFLISYVVEPTAFSYDSLFKIVLSSALCSAISILVFRIYRSVIRYSAFIETGRLALASALKVLLVAPVIFTLTELPIFIFFLGALADFFISYFMLTIVRAMLIITYNAIVSNATSGNGKLLVYGTSEALFLSGQPLQDKSGTYKVEGYLVLNENSSLRIGRHSVYSARNQKEFDELIKRRGITAVLFSDYHAVKNESERLVRYCEKRKIRMLLLPSVDEIKGGVINMRYLPEVRIEDLLGRNEIKINMAEIASELSDKVVLVTGAAGSIGSELCRQLCSFNVKRLVLLDAAETPMHTIRLELEEKYPQVEFVPVMGDVRMAARVESVFQYYQPQYVFHAAAYKHVPLMEENPCEAIHTNVFGTRNVADMSVKYHVDKFVMVSTDKAVNPTNVMGASKRLAEIYVQSLSIAITKGQHPGKTRFVTTRFGNVLGSNGSVIPRFREQLAKGGPLTVTHPDIIRYFMTIPEACRLVLEAAFMGKGDEIFVFDMGTPVKIADLAYRMIELAGLTDDVKIQYTGLRPGEKLYEELLATKENTIPTGNTKIFRAQVREYDYDEICSMMNPLIALALKVDKTGTVKMMKEIVPEFKSKNSEYERLDNLCSKQSGA